MLFQVFVDEGAGKTRCSFEIEEFLQPVRGEKISEAARLFGNQKECLRAAKNSFTLEVTGLSKILVVYESKYGNTKRVAETIVEGMKRVTGTETTLSEVKDLDVNTIASYGAIVIGGPTHFGGPTRAIKKLINKLSSFSSESKQFAVFDTYLGGDFEKGIKKMERIIGENAPAMKMAAPGLSIKVEGMKGPVAGGELSKCEEFGVKIASQLMPAA
ncbi:MAG: flavodoxin family protein [Halobacteriota archaeon]